MFAYSIPDCNVFMLDDIVAPPTNLMLLYLTQIQNTNKNLDAFDPYFLTCARYTTHSRNIIIQRRVGGASFSTTIRLENIMKTTVNNGFQPTYWGV